MTTQQPKSANDLAEDRTDLATARTLMAMDRSLMAWIRTSLSMISFGFTIYKVLQGFQESGEVLAHGYSPRSVGLFLTGLGTISMLAGTIEYFQRLKLLREYHAVKTWRASLVMAVIMSVVGLFVFVSIIAKQL
ncbi:MAG: YidH family protein [Hyphomicrobiaceae bacterium]